MFIDFRKIEGKRGEREKERETVVWEKHWLPLVCNPTRYRTPNLGNCPDWEWNLRPFGIRDSAPPKQATRPGQTLFFNTVMKVLCFSDYDLIWELMDLNLFFSVTAQDPLENPSHIRDLVVVITVLTVKCYSHLGPQGTCFSWHFITISYRW